MLSSLPVITAALGAILGATLAYWLQRARPIVIIDSMRLAVDQADDKVKTSVNRALILELDQYEKDLGFREIREKSSATERDYVVVLSQALLELQGETDNYLARVQEAAQEFQDHLVADEYDLAIQSLARDSDLLWNILATATRRGQFSFPEPRMESTDKKVGDARKEYYEVVREADAFVIHVAGPYGIALYTDYGKGRDSKLEGVAERVANAVAYRHRADLFTMVSSIQSIVADRISRTNDLVQCVAQELDPHRRFVIEGVLANAGRTSFSVFNRGKLVVNLKGFSSQGRTLDDDVQVLLQLAAASARYQPAGVRRDAEAVARPDSNSTLDFLTPVLVSAGQSQRFTCVSNFAVNDLRFSGKLLEAFKEGKRVSYLVLGSIKNRRHQFKAIYSRDILFRDLVDTADLPPRSSWMRRRR